MGVEIAGKTLGVLGCGNIGSIVADRALGLKMRVLAFDPFLTEERAQALGVEKVELDDLLARADFITLHTPLTAQTKNILSAEALAKTRKGVRIVNCARGGLLDEAALRAALDLGHVAGAALDVFEVEPATENPLFGHPHVVCTPHLGAATTEAQEKVALQVAEQISDYLTRGAIANAVNFPSISAEEAPRLKPFVALAEKLGLFAGQVAHSGVVRLAIVFEGAIAKQKTKALTAAALSGRLRPILDDANPVSAPAVAKARGIVVEETTREGLSDYESLVTLVASTAEGEIKIAGTVFHDGKPRITGIGDIAVDAEFAPAMIYVQNEDRPGFIGRFAGVLGEANVNIATFALGRDSPGGCAVAMVAMDGDLPPGALATIRSLPGVKQATILGF
jgi:D-3-phosphoglycerate dehydrogenase